MWDTTILRVSVVCSVRRSPPCSTHPSEQGKLLAEAAIALMNNEKVGASQNVLPPELVIMKFHAELAPRKGSPLAGQPKAAQ